MSVTNTIDKKINNYLSHLSIKQKEAVLTVVKTFAEEEQPAWADKDLIALLDRRTAEYETGKAKAFSLDQMERNAHRYHKTQSRKRK